MLTPKVTMFSLYLFWGKTGKKDTCLKEGGGGKKKADKSIQRNNRTLAVKKQIV